MHSDSETVFPKDPTFTKDPKSGWDSLFFLDKSLKAHRISRNYSKLYDKEPKFEIMQTFDFSGHSLPNHDWNLMHISSKPIVDGDVVCVVKTGTSDDSNGLIKSLQ